MYTEEKIENEIKRIISEQLNTPETDIKRTDSFSTDLGADSLDIVEIILSLEEKFDIEINETDLADYSVGAAIDIVKSKIPNDKKDF